MQEMCGAQGVNIAYIVVEGFHKACKGCEGLLLEIPLAGRRVTLRITNIKKIAEEKEIPTRTGTLREESDRVVLEDGDRTIVLTKAEKAELIRTLRWVLADGLGTLVSIARNFLKSRELLFAKAETLKPIAKEVVRFDDGIDRYLRIEITWGPLSGFLFVDADFNSDTVGDLFVRYWQDDAIIIDVENDLVKIRVWKPGAVPHFYRKMIRRMRHVVQRVFGNEAPNRMAGIK